MLHYFKESTFFRAGTACSTSSHHWESFWPNKKFDHAPLGPAPFFVRFLTQFYVFLDCLCLGSQIGSVQLLAEMSYFFVSFMKIPRGHFFCFSQFRFLAPGVGLEVRVSGKKKISFADFWKLDHFEQKYFFAIFWRGGQFFFFADFWKFIQFEQKKNAFFLLVKLWCLICRVS